MEFDLMDAIASIFGIALCLAIAWSNWPRKTPSTTSFEPTNYDDWIA